MGKSPPPTPSRDSPAAAAERALIKTKLDQEEARLRLLEVEREEAKARLAALRSGLAALDEGPVPQRQSSGSRTAAPQSSQEKVTLFRQLFRGREDLYPTRFVSKKTGKAGYAPACSNKFVAGVCELPKVKCGDCANQAFRPVDDGAVLRHLRGKQVMGVYPMLPDETCWFLAADFDKSSWKEDVRAFAETARRLGLPVLVERSRSRNGAHVWFFFSQPVASATARKMGCHLITETMASRHELSMDSYDRLFPSQDTMPRGGFGNLIALPLQHGPRQEGNSVFLDESLNAYPDDQQWSVLASSQRIEAATVERIALDATRSGTIVGVRVAEAADDAEEAAPWTRPPSGPPRPRRVPGPMPARMSAVLAQRLFIAKDSVPSPLLNQVKRLAAFQNPEFYKKQSMRLSTAMTPRVISCAAELPGHVALPRGCRVALEGLLGVHGVALDVVDERVVGAPLDLRFHGALTAVQESAVTALLAHDMGVFVAPPGVGKTVVGTYLVASRACSTLVLVHRRPLLDQWLAQLALFLGLDRNEIGQIAGSKRTPTGRLDVAMIQSLVRKDSVADLVAGYGQVIVDECHHLPAVQFERVLSEVKARYVVGLTATPQRRDGHHPITEMQLGPVRFKVAAKSQMAARPFEHRLIVRETSFRVPTSDKASGIREVYAALARDEARNVVILNDVVRALEEHRSPILLTERKDHLDYFAERLQRVVRHLVVLQGGMGVKADRAVRAQLEAIPPNEERLLLATGRYIGEGFDDSRLDTLFLALPVSWKGTLVQYTGRLHRLHPGKREVRIFDYVDRNVLMLLRMFEKRLREYRAIGYARGETPLGYGEPKEEYDDDVLRGFDHESATDRREDFADV
ncbi:MAG TPA: DEAD/DEAH box helicase family protein [Polyangiaceae bacterium]|nr:DEAD/DEAH box helicase family protein [Polyangiaceae bacterium]